MTKSERRAIVFHILYGPRPDGPERELVEWRLEAARYVSGKGPVPPLLFQDFQAAKVQAKK